jgi:hypothetical protein
MEDDFDLDAAVEEVGSGLGFDREDTPDDDVVLEVSAKEVPNTPAPAPGEATPTTATTTPTVDEAPTTWRKEASATWAALPSEAKAEILKREADIFKGIETYKVDAAFGQGVKQAIAPFEQVMRQHNMDPATTIRGLLASHHVLATGTQAQRVQLFRSLAKDYNLDMGVLLPQQPAGEPPYIDPAVASLQEKLSAVESELTQARQARFNESRNTISRQVSSFADDQRNIYFNEVADEMAGLIQRGIAGTVQEAYEKAIWLNPVTRMKEAARVTAEQTSTAQAAAAAKLMAAKAATAANVQTRAKSGSATTTLGSLDDTLSAALANIKSRGG